MKLIIWSTFIIFFEITVAFSLNEITLRRSNKFSSKARRTVPLNNNQILDLIEKLRVESSCFKSQTCARLWMKKYNFILTKLNEKSSVLQNLLFSRNSSPKWNEKLKRMLKLASSGIEYKDSNQAVQVSKLMNNLQEIYASTKVCENNMTNCYSLEPDLQEIFKKSRNYDQLLFAWKGWFEQSGGRMRKQFSEIVKIQNENARSNNYSDLSEIWLEDFEDKNFEINSDKLYSQVKPLYTQLHTYVRRKLKAFYGEKLKNHDPNLIPAHILGNVWSQSWENIYDLVIPYPNSKITNVTENLIKNNYTTLKIFERAEDFFVSIGLYKMTPSFWSNSMIEKPENKIVECHGSAYDFYNGFDYRIKMCTSVNEEYFYIVHHEMGHIEYFMTYKNQPTIFKEGANSAFHEAIGDTIALSTLSPTHLKRIKLTESDQMSHEQEINFLMRSALEKIAFIPYSYMIDKWRLEVFRGNINPTNYNLKWWEMVKNIQGLEPPINRSENNFDPGAKFHIASFVPYSRYFISTFLQYQFYKSACELSNHKGPLYKCDFYGSKKAGFYLKKMLSLGSSTHWKNALEILTKKREVTADAILDYFKPLEEWLKNENSKIREF